MNRTTIQYRRFPFIQRVYLGQLVTWMIAFGIIASLCSVVISYLLLKSDLGSQLSDVHVHLGQAQKMLTLSVVVGSTVGLFMAGIIIAVTLLYASHHLAGPLRRFRHLCLAIAQGDLTGSTVYLRKNDELHALAGAFETLLESLRSRREQQQQALERAHTALRQLRAEPTEAAEALESLDAALVTLADSLGERE